VTRSMQRCIDAVRPPCEQRRTTREHGITPRRSSRALIDVLSSVYERDYRGSRP
jgi:hypothetical protein